MKYSLLILAGICLAGSGLCGAEDTAGQTNLTTFAEQNFGVRFSHSTNLTTSYNPHGGADSVMLAYNGKPIGGLLVRPAPPAESIKVFIEMGRQYYKEKWGASTVDYKVYENPRKYTFHRLKAEVKQNGKEYVLERFVHLRDDTKPPADADEKVIRSMFGAFSFEFAYFTEDREMVAREIKTVIDTFKIEATSAPKPDKQNQSTNANILAEASVPNGTPRILAPESVTNGMSRAMVIAILGSPKGSMGASNRETLIYEKGKVGLVDGKVVNFDFYSQAELERRKNARENAIESSTSNEAALDPEATVDELQQAANVVGRYFFTLGTDDRAGNMRISYPALESAALCERLFYPRDIDDDTIAKVREEVSSDMGLTQETPFRYRGSAVKPDGKGRYPVGTTVVLGTEHVGTSQAFSPLLYGTHDCTLIPVVKTDGGWKVDVRFWLARLDSQSSKPDTNLISQEEVIREFLKRSFRRKIGALKDVVPTGSDYLFLTNSLIARAEVELFEKLEDSPLCLAQAQVGEAMLLADNTVVTAQAGTEHSKWLVGLLGRRQRLLFELRREQSGWRLVPRDYIGVIRNSETECGALGTSAKLKIVLPPVRTKGRVQ